MSYDKQNENKKSEKLKYGKNLNFYAVSDIKPIGV